MKVHIIDAATLHHRLSLQIAGTRCEVRTNRSCVASTLEDWRITEAENCAAGFSMEILVTAGADAIGETHFRGLHHVVVASFAPANIFVFDLLRRTIAATVSENVARDRQFWNEILLPIAMGVLGATLGVVPVHCACLSIEHAGLLVAGVSGAGKSTLSAALVQSGFDYVSDDWTYLRTQGERLVAHGLSVPLKLLPDAAVHFPELAQHLPRTSLNGESAYEVPARVFGARMVRSCEARWCVLLERSTVSESNFTPIGAEEVGAYLQSSVERLPSQLTAASQSRTEILERMGCLPCWRFSYGGTPQFAAQELRSFVRHQEGGVAA